MTNNQARHIYIKVKLGDIINVDTSKQEIEEDKLGRNNIDDDDDDDDDDEVTPYHEIITNNIEKENIITSQMEQWSILSKVFIMCSMIGTLEIFMT